MTAFRWIGPEHSLDVPEGTPLHRGTLAEAGAWLPALEAELRARSGLRVAGGLPFHAEDPVRLHLTRAEWRASPPVSGPVGTTLVDSWTRAPADAAYEAGVRAALDTFATGELEKVVLARALELEEVVSDPLAFAEALRADNPNARIYALKLEAERWLVGASPELLLSRRGHRVESLPLAGSMPRGQTREEDAANAARLEGSAKDRHEHALVAEHIEATLRPFCHTLTLSSQVVRTSSMLHLGTRIVGELKRPVSSLELAVALHPTPAVCGVPVEPARAFIRDHEALDRGMYAGLVGSMEASGDGDWWVALRCAEIGPRSTKLIAGAGIVPGSDPSAERIETHAKMKTVARALARCRASA